MISILSRVMPTEIFEYYVVETSYCKAVTFFQEKYLQEKVKVGGKTNNFGNNVVLERNKMKLTINSDVDFSKR